MQCPKKKTLCRRLIGSGFLLLCSHAQAVPWQLDATLDVYEQYTDNVFGSAETGSAQQALVTGISPGLSMVRSGPRLSLALNSQWQYRRYSGVDVRDTSAPNLVAKSRFDLVKNRVFLDADTRYGQTLNNPVGGLAFGNTLLTGNRINYQAYRAGATWQQKYRRFAQSTVNYRIDRADYSTGLYGNYEARTLTASLDNGSSFRNIIWNLRHSNSKTRYQAGLDPVYIKTSATLGYRFSRKLSLSYTMGEEDNTLVQQGFTSQVRYTYWYVSAQYNPTVRTQLGLNYGRRFFGQTYGLDLTHRARRSDWSLAYNEDVSTRSLFATEERNLLLVDENGQPLLDPPTGLPLVTTGLFPVLVDNSFINRIWSASSRLQSRRTTLSLSGSYNRRSYVGVDQRNDTFYSGRFGWKVNLNTRAEVSLGGYWSRYRIGLLQQNSNTIWQILANYSHRLDRRTRFVTSASYYARLSPVPAQRQRGVSLYAGINIQL